MSYKTVVDWFEKASELVEGQVRFECGFEEDVNKQTDGESHLSFPFINLTPPVFSGGVYKNMRSYDIVMYFIGQKNIDPNQNTVADFTNVIDELQILADAYFVKLFDTSLQVSNYSEPMLQQLTEPILRPNENKMIVGDYFLSCSFKVGEPKKEC